MDKYVELPVLAHSQGFPCTHAYIKSKFANAEKSFKQPPLILCSSLVWVFSDAVYYINRSGCEENADRVQRNGWAVYV